MNVVVQRPIIENICSSLSKQEISDFLNGIIDNELNKVNIDTELIDACIDALDELENDNAVPALRVVITERSVASYCRRHSNLPSIKRLSTVARIAIIAAAMTTGTLIVNAGVQAVTGVDVINEIGTAVIHQMQDWGIIADVDNNAPALYPASNKPHPHHPANTTAVDNAVEQITQKPDSTTKSESNDPVIPPADDANDSVIVVPAVTDPSDDRQHTTVPDKPVFVALVADTGSVKRNYIYGEKLTYDGLKLSARYSDNTEQALDISDCAYTKNIDMNVTADYTLEISYKSCSLNIDITVRPDEETRGSTICTYGDYDYLLTSQGAYVTKYIGSGGGVTLDTINGSTVIAVSAKAFAGSDVAAFSSNTVKRVGNGAFADCKSLGYCDLPAVENIGRAVWQNDTALTSVTFGDNLATIGDRCLQNTAVKALILPEKITAVPDYLCSGCGSLEYVRFDGKVTDIGDCAFLECASLTNVYNSEFIINVGYCAFLDDALLTMDSALPALSKVGESAFEYCSSIDFGTVGAGLTELGASAFAYCDGISGIIIPSSITTVPASAFRNVPATSLIINEGVRSIGSNAFMGTKISAVTLPSTLAHIGEYGLYSTRLYNVYFLGNTADIAPTAFYLSKRVTFYAPQNSYPLIYAENNGAKSVAQ